MTNMDRRAQATRAHRAAGRTLRAPGPKVGDRYELRGLEFRVVIAHPLTMIGPARICRKVSAKNLESMEKING